MLEDLDEGLLRDHSRDVLKADIRFEIHSKALLRNSLENERSHNCSESVFLLLEGVLSEGLILRLLNVAGDWLLINFLKTYEVLEVAEVDDVVSFNVEELLQLLLLVLQKRNVDGLESLVELIHGDFLFSGLLLFDPEQFLEAHLFHPQFAAEVLEDSEGPVGGVADFERAVGRAEGVDELVVAQFPV